MLYDLILIPNSNEHMLFYKSLLPQNCLWFVVDASLPRLYQNTQTSRHGYVRFMVKLVFVPKTANDEGLSMNEPLYAK